MSSIGVSTETSTEAPGLGIVDMKLDVVLPVSDVDVSKVFHDETSIFHRAGTVGRVSGPDPEGRSYSSFVSFSDPDGNGWVIQEIKTRLPGREWASED
jgi:hypothetical protein